MRSRGAGRIFSSLIQRPEIHCELLGNIISPTTGAAIGSLHINHGTGMLIVWAADVVPCWALMVLHKRRQQDRGFV